MKHKKVYRILNYFEHLLLLISKITGCVSISAFASSVGIPIEITSSVLRLELCAITSGIKKYESIIKKKKHDKIFSLAKSKLNNLEVFIS